MYARYNADCKRNTYRMYQAKNTKYRIRKKSESIARLEKEDKKEKEEEEQR